uniref:Uncharacterized protein n=1 Tax=Strigamia maritima TaxID=126957 RepID=T1IV84_STRMM
MLSLDCYESLDECAVANKTYYAQTIDQCCSYSKAIAYSSTRGVCNLCKQFRPNRIVHCFQEIYWIGERSCHELHLETTTLLNCCVHRGAHRGKTAQGFHFKKVVMNSTIPTYLCIPCEEAIKKASKWTAWSPCNSTCNGGYKSRKKNCENDINKSPDALCVGEITEINNCNDHPCPHSKLHTIEATEWTTWSPCNSTPVSDYQTRTRICGENDDDSITSVCIGKVIEIKNCNHRTMSIIVIALIAIISFISLVLIVLITYTCCKKKKHAVNSALRIPIEFNDSNT